MQSYAKDFDECWYNGPLDKKPQRKGGDYLRLQNQQGLFNRLRLFVVILLLYAVTDRLHRVWTIYDNLCAINIWMIWTRKKEGKIIVECVFDNEFWRTCIMMKVVLTSARIFDPITIIRQYALWWVSREPIPVGSKSKTRTSSSCQAYFFDMTWMMNTYGYGTPSYDVNFYYFMKYVDEWL